MLPPQFIEIFAFFVQVFSAKTPLNFTHIYDIIVYKTYFQEGLWTTRTWLAR